jgi:hypothetical protein
MGKLKVLGGNTRPRRRLLDRPVILPEDRARAARWRAEDRRASNALIAYHQHRMERLPTWLVRGVGLARDHESDDDRIPVMVIYDRLRTTSLVCLWLRDWKTLVGPELRP